MRICKKLISMTLAFSLFFSSTSYAAPASSTTESTTESTETTFEWNDETKDDAWGVFEDTDWKESQKSLIYDGLQNGTAKARVSDEVRALEKDVKSVLESLTTGNDVSMKYHVLGSLSNMTTDYTELVLAMIQVLGEDAGVLETGAAENDRMIDGAADGFKEIFGMDGSFKNFKEHIGQYVLPESEEGFKNGVATIVNAYSQSVRDWLLKAKKDHPNENDNRSYDEPYIFSNDSSLAAVVEGVVMHYGGSGNYISNTYPLKCNTSSDKPYTSKKARSYYKSNKASIDSYYASLKDYYPSEDFAERVLSIYTVTTGNTGSTTGSASMQTYIDRVNAGAATTRVQAFLAELSKHDKKPYVWGAVGPNSFDCSGLISYCLKKSGAIPNFSRQVSGWFPNHMKRVSLANAQPGDIMWHSGHVMVYLEPNYAFEAKGKAYGVGFFKRDASKQTILRWW